MENARNKEISIIRILIKTAIFLILINFLWAFLPQDIVGKISIYNVLISGRKRFPFGENPDLSYNLSLYNLDAMFASHAVSAYDEGDSYRVILVGDSSIWGFLQTPEQSLSGLLNTSLKESGIEFVNLGYPSISILKDLQIIDYATRYDPDLIVWFTTLESLPIDAQMSIPINANNQDRINTLIDKYDLRAFEKKETQLFSRTFWAQRRNIYDVIRLQLYGFLWQATGIDQEYPASYRPAQRDFPDPIDTYHGANNVHQLASSLSLNVIKQAIQENTQTDFIVVNEPILISEGENADDQYNYYYPRWAYDAYREIINTFTDQNDIKYYDFWDLVPENEFTNSAIHLSENGVRLFANEMYKIIIEHRSNKH